MRGSFYVGMALGAIAGIVVLENSMGAKKMLQKGKNMVQRKIGAMKASADGSQNN